MNARLLELIDTQLADARAQLDDAEAQIAAGRAEYERQLKNFGNTVSDTVMAQMGTEVADAVTVVRDQAQALLNSVNQLIGVVNEPEIQQALIDVRDGLQRVVDQFNQTGMRDIDSLIEIVGELRDITDKLTAALQELQGRLGTSDGTVSDLADELEVSNSLSTIYKTLDRGHQSHGQCPRPDEPVLRRSGHLFQPAAQRLYAVHRGPGEAEGL